LDFAIEAADARFQTLAILHENIRKVNIALRRPILLLQLLIYLFL
jgi:hypothetical protein